MEKVNRVGRVLAMACFLLAMAAGEGLAQSRDTHPTEAGNVLDAIPSPGSVIPYGLPQGWWDFKDDVYDKIGLRFGFSYQMLGQAASDVLPNATHDTALGDWWGFLTKWTLLDRAAM